MPGEVSRVLTHADSAVLRRVDLLGSGQIEIAESIDWNRDYKSGWSWPNRYGPSTNYADLGRESDVKFPWELSRLQWLLPCGLAYRVTGDERYSVAVRKTLEEWIGANPFAHSVNWAIAMEAALRIVTWSWFFHVFAESPSWADRGFRRSFLGNLYAHAEFVDRHLERSDINGNHYTADAMGLVFAGLFFGEWGGSNVFASKGWKILTEELPRQTTADGVDFEASTAYHRFVSEMFALSALYRLRCGLPIPQLFRDRLQAMARFVEVYSRPSGSTPLWGDADDGRVLPLGSQALADHRYLVDLIDVVLGPAPASSRLSPDASELFWLTGTRPPTVRSGRSKDSVAFPDGGVYVMRTERDHVFVDCGPVGMAGRGGHGHNDCLSFELVLDDVHLVTDSGTYTYTTSVELRNRFRATAAHNTPIVDGHELNRFVHPDFLWLLRNDAIPTVAIWRLAPDRDMLQARHNGYRRLQHPVLVQRLFSLDRLAHSFSWRDDFLGDGEHEVRELIHLAPDVRVSDTTNAGCVLEAKGNKFSVAWDSPAHWTFGSSDSWVSPSYGVRLPNVRLELSRRGPLAPLTLTVAQIPPGAERSGRTASD